MLFFKNISITILLIAALAKQDVFAQKIIYSASQIEKIKLAHKTLLFAILHKDSVKIAEAYYTIGRHEAEAGNFLSSFKFYFKSLKILETKGYSYELGRIYLRLYGVEYAQGHYAQSLKFIQAAIFIYQKVKSDYGLSQAYCNYADFYFPEINSKKLLYFKPNYDSIVYYYKKSEHYSRKINDTLGLAYLQFKFGNFYESQLNPKAIPYYQSVINIYFIRNDIRLLIHSMLSLASAYIAFKEPIKAHKLILNAEHLYQKHYKNEYETQLHLERNYVKYFQAIGNWHEAFVHLETLNSLEKIKTNADNQGAVSRLNIEYETKKKEVQLEKQKAELKLKDENINIQKQYLALVGSMLALTTFLSVVLFRLFKKNQRISHNNAVLIQEQNHRVKNNLQIVSSLLSLQANLLDDPKAKQAVDESQFRIEAMAILHRQLYDTEQLDKIDMRDFVREISEIIFKSYGLADVETMYNITILDMPADKAIFFGLMLNELISNACKYAFQQHLTPVLTISLTETPNEIVLKVKDNGTKKIIIKPSKNSASFGMKLINMMAVQLDGTVESKFDKGMEFLIKCKS